MPTIIKSLTGKTLLELPQDSLIHADLSDADLSDADLRSANLYGADLSGADLRSAKGLTRRQMASFVIVPAGTLRVFKKLRDGIIAELEIPTEAGRVNAYGSRKCRFEFAKVVKLSKRQKEGAAQHDGTSYRVGETVRPDSFDPSPLVECSHGIHAFLTREEAEAY